MRLRGDCDVDLSFQRGCGQNIESNRVISCAYTFSLGYKSTVGPQGLGVKEKLILEECHSQNGMERSSVREVESKASGVGKFSDGGIGTSNPRLSPTLRRSGGSARRYSSRE